MEEILQQLRIFVHLLALIYRGSCTVAASSVNSLVWLAVLRKNVEVCCRNCIFCRRKSWAQSLVSLWSSHSYFLALWCCSLSVTGIVVLSWCK